MDLLNKLTKRLPEHDKFEIETSIDQVTDRLKEDSRIDIENGNIDIGGLKSVQNEIKRRNIRFLSLLLDLVYLCGITARFLDSYLKV